MAWTSLERIKRGYRAIGPGAPRDVLAMFHQEQDDPPEWVIDESGRLSRHPRRGRHGPLRRRSAVAVGGHRRRAAQLGPVREEVAGWWWAAGSALVSAAPGRSCPLPFIHVWSFCDDQVQNVFDYFGGVEVKRRVDVCPPRAAGDSGGTPARWAEGPQGLRTRAGRRAGRGACAAPCSPAARPRPGARTPLRGWARGGGPARGRRRSRPAPGGCVISCQWKLTVSVRWSQTPQRRLPRSRTTTAAGAAPTSGT